jgi:predicted transcriptional regulator
VREIMKATGMRPLAWTLMDNHVHLPGGQRREVSKVGVEMVYFLRREAGISMAEIARKLGVEASAMVSKY